jgi:RNA:NAD 2'-phosphotransferase (TPT1/KptA family)
MTMQVGQNSNKEQPSTRFGTGFDQRLTTSSSSSRDTLKFVASSDAELSKTVSHALRHEPSAYGLVLDGEGWVSVQDLVAALKRKHPAWQNLDEHQLQQMVERSQKQRHEIIGGRIRALYGHSTAERLAKQAGVPPEILYHGTDAHPP